MLPVPISFFHSVSLCKMNLRTSDLLTVETGVRTLVELNNGGFILTSHPKGESGYVVDPPNSPPMVAEGKGVAEPLSR